MADLGWFFGVACLLLAGIAVGLERRKAKKTMESLDAMLSCAMEGDFRETTFDESLLSALETRMVQFLSASTCSAQQVASEQQRIQALIGDISHQTKTPIANLRLYAELLQEEELPPEAKEYAETLYAQTEKLRFLIDALVKLSRLENGIITLHPERSCLAPVLTQVEQQFLPRAQSRGLLLSVLPSEEVACFDAKWTAEALCNLVDNAIKYTNKGSVSVSVTPYEMFVRVDVADTGIGISEEEQAKIFRRFYRVEGSAQQDGVGIGLYLTRDILRREGGYLKVTSKPGEGAVFSMFLPV